MTAWQQIIGIGEKVNKTGLLSVISIYLHLSHICNENYDIGKKK
jgi:hypothetical protein